MPVIGSTTHYDTAEEKKISSINIWSVESSNVKNRTKTKKYKTMYNNYGINTLWGYWRRDKGPKVAFETMNFSKLMSDTKQTKKV